MAEISGSRKLSFLLVLVMALVSSQRCLADGDATVHITGDVSPAHDWTAAQLKEKFAGEMKLIQYSTHGQTHTSSCIPLLSVLKASGVQTEAKMDPTAKPTQKSPYLHVAIWLQGRDGYSVVLGLGELMPDFGNHSAWLAVDMDEHPLTENEGPLKLILPQDLKPGRYVHGISEIIIQDHAPAATQPTIRP